MKSDSIKPLRRVGLHHNGKYRYIIGSWEDFVIKPLNENRFIEAFASADAMIDHVILMNLQKLYYTEQSTDLIREIHKLRPKIPFEGLILLKILESKGIVEKQLVKKIEKFKKKRNLVTHNIEGEYYLVLYNQPKYSNQEELDIAVEKEAKKILDEARSTYEELQNILMNNNKSQRIYI